MVALVELVDALSLAFRNFLDKGSVGMTVTYPDGCRNAETGHCLAK